MVIHSFELFVLGEGEKKLEEKPVAGMPNTSDFIIKKEDHTIGNLFSEHLKMHPKVLMAGYKSKRGLHSSWSLRSFTDHFLLA